MVMAPPSILAVVAEELSLDVAARSVQVVFGLIILFGGLLGSVLQVSALRPYTSRALWWIGATAVSWALTAMAMPDLGEVGAGFVLAAVSGAFFVWLMRASI